MEILLKELHRDRATSKLVFMPLSRVLVEETLTIGRFKIFPPGSVDLSAFRPITSCETLREFSTTLTGFSVETLATSPLIAFIATINWPTFLSASHNDDLETLRILSATAERAFDVLRLYQCRLDLPDTLPGSIGSWDGSGPYLGAMIYSPGDHESYVIAGAAANYTAVMSGIGLDLSFEYPEPLPSPSDGEVGANVVHALSLLSDAMHSANDTNKFVRVMTLLEFLASPDEYKSWKRLKGDIACHCAHSPKHYNQIIERFKELTSIKDEQDIQRGYRTLVVHHGKFMEELIPEKNKRRKLFCELQGYCQSVIDDMLSHRTLSWDEFTERRNLMKTALGVHCEA